MTRAPRKRTTKATTKVIEPTGSALERIEDLAFDAQVKRLAHKRPFPRDVMELAFLLHGSTLADRESA